MIRRVHLGSVLLPLALTVLVVTGCASTGASVKPAGLEQRPLDLAAYRSLGLQVTKAKEVTVAEADLERIAGRIVDAIRKTQPERFQEINAASPADPEAPTVQVTVQLTRYDKGSAFARAMLAGLGQIHVDAKVILKDRATDGTLGEFDVKKTFAWGGIYGGTTTIEDVEVGFAAGVASLLLGSKTP